MEARIEPIPAGTVTSPHGFRAGATYAGIKKRAEDTLDLGILCSEAPCRAAALFTASKIKAAPVILSRKRLRSGKATAVVANSGCANASTGQQGLDDATEMTALVAEITGAPANRVLVASTGVIGHYLPMERVRASLKQIALNTDGGHQLARAIMTTDTMAKETAVAVSAGADSFTIGGVAKGSGMIHPNLATLLCLLTTDAAVDSRFLKLALKKAVDISFNMISIDGDTSPNDMVLLMANGMAGNQPISADSQEAFIFQQALERVCTKLAKATARDGEGATKLIAVTVGGAATTSQARQAARTIVSSPLVKAAIHGNDPNWGRIIAAAGRSGVKLVEAKLELYLGNVCLMKAGCPLPFHQDEAVKILAGDEVPINLQLNLGAATATAWGCDLSQEYVTINSQYST